MDECSSATDLAKTIDVLDALLWLKSAWECVSAMTIQKCFLKCGFNVGEECEIPEVPEVPDAVPDTYHVVLGNISLDDFSSMDDATET